MSPQRLDAFRGIGVGFTLPSVFLDFQAKLRDATSVVQELSTTENERWRFQKRRRRMHTALMPQ